MRALLVACLALGCQSTAPAPTGPRAAPAGADLTPAQLIERMTSTYRAARSYVDRGASTSVITRAGRAHTKALTFATAFARPDRFRFTYLEEGDPSRASGVWMGGGITRSYRYRVPGRFDVDRDFGAAIAAATNSSSGTGLIVPSLLLPDAVGRTPWPRIKNLADGGDEPIDGRPCRRVTADWAGQAVTLWIDRETFLLRRMMLRRHVEPKAGERGEFDVVQTIRYEPQLDVAIADADLATPDPAAPPAEPATWLGVSFAPGTTTIRQVLAGGPAGAAGVLVGDRLVAIDGRGVAQLADVLSIVAPLAVGTRVELSLLRNGVAVKLPLAIAARPPLRAVQRATLLDKPAPDVVLRTLDGGTTRLADHKGKVVVIDFWATWCKPCVIAMPQLDAWQRELGARGLVVIGVTNDDIDKVRRFVADHRLGYPIALDPDSDTWRDYLVQGIPTSIIIDRAGIVRHIELGLGDTTKAKAAIVRLLR